MKNKLVVLGAGPAGINAALSASSLGMNVTLIDENDQAGGQIYRAKNKSFVSVHKNPESIEGDQLRQRLVNSPVGVQYNSRIWHLERDNAKFNISVLNEKGNRVISTDKLLLSTGAQERIFPVPGWTLPGVMGLGAATALLKGQMVVPGKRVLVAGTGPLLLVVAHEILRMGGKVIAIVDLNPLSAWIKKTPALMSSPRLVSRGAGWIVRILMNRVPIYSGFGLISIEGEKYVEAVNIGKVDATWMLTGKQKHKFDVDCVCMAQGLVPATETSQLLGAKQEFNPDEGGWKPACDQYGRTSVPGLLVAGDCAGIQGAEAALIRGELATLAAAADFGIISADDVEHRSTDLLKRLKRVRKFGGAMTLLSNPRAGLIKAMTDDTIICRCEDIRLKDVITEIAAGNRMPNTIKSTTRCGMGPCGGRYCSETVAMLACEILGMPRSQWGQASARSPIRPVKIGKISGDFSYEELPIPASAPL
ncbi:MAG: FAD-dependent oxidoreductase [Cohaesibacteraceae bacterium]|nr:FAD-dependent oxidoreductase [Cohaesibacteraceae bacterium]